jgi:hypothetical protein
VILVPALGRSASGAEGGFLVPLDSVDVKAWRIESRMKTYRKIVKEAALTEQV